MVQKNLGSCTADCGSIIEELRGWHLYQRNMEKLDMFGQKAWLDDWLSYAILWQDVKNDKLNSKNLVFLWKVFSNSHNNSYVEKIFERNERDLFPRRGRLLHMIKIFADLIN